jgi:hypothetical protein
MGGVALGFEIAAGFLLFSIALIVILALPGLLLRVTVGTVVGVTKWLDENLSKKALKAHKPDIINFLIGFAFVAAPIVFASMLAGVH